MNVSVANIYRLGIKELWSLVRDPMMLVLIVYTFSVSIYIAATAMLPIILTGANTDPRTPARHYRAFAGDARDTSRNYAGQSLVHGSGGDVGRIHHAFCVGRSGHSLPWRGYRCSVAAQFLAILAIGSVLFIASMVRFRKTIGQMA
jgi:hypothetical protein